MKINDVESVTKVGKAEKLKGKSFFISILYLYLTVFHVKNGNIQ